MFGRVLDSFTKAFFTRGAGGRLRKLSDERFEFITVGTPVGFFIIGVAFSKTRKRRIIIERDKDRQMIGSHSCTDRPIDGQSQMGGNKRDMRRRGPLVVDSTGWNTCVDVLVENAQIRVLDSHSKVVSSVIVPWELPQRMMVVQVARDDAFTRRVDYNEVEVRFVPTIANRGSRWAVNVENT